MQSLPFPYAHASGNAIPQLLQECYAQLGSLHDQYRLGFIYVSDTLSTELTTIMQQLQQHYPAVEWVGTIGSAICATGTEYYPGDHAMALLVTDIDPQHYRRLPPAVDMDNPWDVQLTTWAAKQEYIFALVHADPQDRITMTLLNELIELGQNSFINGGLSSGEGLHYQINGDEIRHGGLSGVLFSADVGIITDHTQGCLPVGEKHPITEFEDNILVRLGDQPPLQILKEEVGEPYASKLESISGQIFAAFPIEGMDNSDYIVRNLIAIDPRHGIIAIAEDLHSHSQMMFCRRDKESAWQDLQLMLQRIQKRLGSQTIRGGIYVNCLGRGRHQFASGEELQLIQDVLGEFPLVGFFANGEIYHNRIYGYTGVLTLFV